MTASRGETGSVTVLVAVVVVLSTACAVVLGKLGSGVAAVERAQSTADAVALATAVAGDPAGAAVASANDASVVGVARRDGMVVVRVERSDVRALSAAEVRLDGR